MAAGRGRRGRHGAGEGVEAEFQAAFAGPVDRAAGGPRLDHGTAAAGDPGPAGGSSGAEAGLPLARPPARPGSRGGLPRGCQVPEAARRLRPGAATPGPDPASSADPAGVVGKTCGGGAGGARAREVPHLSRPLLQRPLRRPRRGPLPRHGGSGRGAAGVPTQSEPRRSPRALRRAPPLRWHHDSSAFQIPRCRTAREERVAPSSYCRQSRHSSQAGRIAVADIPSKANHREFEPRWMAQWEAWGLYRWDPARPRNETFVVDSPPPTVSGSLHVGHVFSYTHQDLLVRYQRMKGRNICYPMGWDDNGLPTERRVQNLFRVRCNPHLPYDPDWQPLRDQSKKAPMVEISRQNFIQACAQVTEEDEKAFEALWRHLGLSIDWSLQYATIDEHCRKVSQASYLELVEKGQAYQSEAPTMWDVDFQTAVAQAEVEDRLQYGAFHDIRFKIEGGGSFIITTTRPELLVACIAVVAHPDDERYRSLFGKHAITPIFGARVPILPAEHADPEKGTGILMVCTFGDSMDVEFWKQAGLGLKQVIGLDGRFLPVEFGKAPFEAADVARAKEAYDQLVGLPVKKVRQEMVALLGRELDSEGESALVSQPRPIEHPVKFYEKGDRPLEFVTTRQWFVRILEHKEALQEQGRKIQWHPSHMRHRYGHWVQGLNQDWCISRQRYFGVPFPVWYPIDAQGHTDYANPIFARRESLPVDPLTDCPPGFQAAQRGQPGGFAGDPDVMDTWATSSLTPQIVSGWERDPGRHGQLFPMDIRPQSHEIIRTWAFYTIVKAWMHSAQVPWHHVVISGWILDPDRKKMSKSAGNVVTPQHLLDEYSSDGVRYWAARARLGADTAFDESVLKDGRRLYIKLFNASRFVLLQLDRAGETDVAAIREPLDLALVARLRELVGQTTHSLEQFDYANALQATEKSFWDFCNDYLELVKRRSYDEEDTPGRRSAVAALHLALRTFVRLFAPYLPYVTEEIWSWRFASDGRERSVHTSPWPALEETQAVPAPEREGMDLAAAELLKKIRAAKTDGQKNLRWPVNQLVVTTTPEHRAVLSPVLEDVLQAGAVEAWEIRDGAGPEGEMFGVEVSLGEAPPAATAPGGARAR
ncbi:MAG: valine--tRNA ligase [Armatimonadetes bacterium]|nr:valine--tRNA ligase [Armatimonadota bacterium]